MNNEQNDANPFESPSATDRNPFHEQPTDSTDASESKRERKIREIGRAFVAWEKLRVIYNISLALIAVPMSLLVFFSSENKVQTIDALAEVCFFGFLGANILFLLGHYITAWMVLLGARARIVTIILFWCGIGISIPLVLILIGSVFTDWLPDQ